MFPPLSLYLFASRSLTQQPLPGNRSLKIISMLNGLRITLLKGSSQATPPKTMEQWVWVTAREVSSLTADSGDSESGG